MVSLSSAGNAVTAAPESTLNLTKVLFTQILVNHALSVSVTVSSHKLSPKNKPSVSSTDISFVADANSPIALFLHTADLAQ